MKTILSVRVLSSAIVPLIAAILSFSTAAQASTPSDSKVLQALSVDPLFQAAMKVGSGFGECSTKLLAPASGTTGRFAAQIFCTSHVGGYDQLDTRVKGHFERGENGPILFIDSIKLQDIVSTATPE